MTSTMVANKYPVFTTEISKDDAKFENADEVIAYIKEQVDAHPVAGYISTFDHYTHTTSLPQYGMPSNIVDIKVAIFCFGPEVPMPEIVAARPRSIGVVEEADKFIVTFMDPPAPVLRDVMTSWINGIRK